MDAVRQADALALLSHCGISRDLVNYFLYPWSRGDYAVLHIRLSLHVEILGRLFPFLTVCYPFQNFLFSLFCDIFNVLCWYKMGFVLIRNSR